VRAHSDGAGQGTRFTVVLPSVHATADHTPLAAAPAAMRLDEVSVLLVDDAADVRDVTAQVLQDAGATVTLASGALEALQLLRCQQPDVILSDIGMPEIDGFELMRRVRSLAPSRGGNIPAVAFTAYTRPEDVSKALAAGFQLHLSKPVPPVTLIAALASLATNAANPATSANSSHAADTENGASNGKDGEAADTENGENGASDANPD
jgi:CheY-like chemotaxis protein